MNIMKKTMIIIAYILGAWAAATGQLQTAVLLYILAEVVDINRTAYNK